MASFVYGFSRPALIDFAKKQSGVAVPFGAVNGQTRFSKEECCFVRCHTSATMRTSALGRTKRRGAVFRPADGLLITNHTQGTAFTLPGFAFESTANQEEILLFCVSRSLPDELRTRFEAVACVEILRVPTLCERLRRALPANAIFHAGRVDYYDEGEGAGTRWALPD